MLNKNMRPIYRKLIIIAILSGCIYGFGYSDRTETVYAAPCIQECDSNYNACNDACGYSCSESSDQQACNSCLQVCTQTHFQCLSYAVSCSGLDTTPGHCSVEFALHCPIENGVANCGSPNAYNDYFMLCENPYGGGLCVACPGPNYYCVGQGSIGYCPYYW